MELPINYKKATRAERKQAREAYIKQQGGVCYYCKSSLKAEVPEGLRKKYVDRGLFPKGFFDHPIHLHHSHKSHMTIGAVHARCNAILWQYHGE